MTWTDTELDHSFVVAAATLDENGVLLEANQGFIRLLATEAALPTESHVGQRVDHCLIQPSFSALKNSHANSDGECYRGLLTLGHYEGKVRTLRACVHRKPGKLRILAEYDIEEIERISDRLLSLNDDYAKAQFELARTNLALQQLKAELEERVVARTEALNDALVQAESANRAKDAFLANMSHELRTPLNHILGFTNILRRKIVDPGQLSSLEKIESAGRTLTDLVNDILLMSKQKAEQLELQAVDFELLPLMAPIAGSMSRRAEAKGLTLHEEIDPGLPSILHGDPRRLSQILTNLLGNAIKFSSRGKITLRICRATTEAGIPAIRFEVEDEGIGISIEQQGVIFQTLAQADNSMTRAYGGAGIGLAICKRLTLLMGGNIGVSSMLGRGSLFWVDIPQEVSLLS